MSDKTKSLRICLDPKALNDTVRIPHYRMRTFNKVLSELSEAAYFSVLVATSGYWNLNLEEKYSYLTTFNTFGRYRYRGSYMSAHVLLNLLNELGKRDKMRGLPSILSLFRNEFNKFNNTRARMLDSIYHMALRLL